METPSNRHPTAIIAHGVLTGAWNRRDPGTAVVKTSGPLGTNDVLSIILTTIFHMKLYY